MAYTFIKAQGGDVGASKVEDEMLGTARDLLERAAAAGSELRLPEDSVCAAAMQSGASTSVHPSDRIPEDLMGLDIGPSARDSFRAALQGAKTVFWNGPMGVFEIPEFATGTMDVAAAVADLNAYTVVGGGDSLAAVSKSGLGDRLSHLSTGGGASLEFLESGELPGLAVLKT